MKEAEILTLLSAFEKRSLNKETWTHDAHLIVACAYVYIYGKDEALIRLRSGIISLNLSMEVQNTTSGGYHETMTLFWVWVISRYIHNKPQEWDLAKTCQEFLQSPCAEKNLPLTFYTKDSLFDISARSRWVEPDKLHLDDKHLDFHYT